ncbi:MAG: alpha/beta hydrolase [Candidatus Eiseniibacteriota bacterium]
MRGVVIATGIASALAAQSLLAPAAEQPIAPREYVYATADSVPLMAYVFVPEGPRPTRPRAAVALFHGGGWVQGEPAWVFSRARRYARLGMVAVAVQYRLSDQKNVTPLEAMADARAAFRWIRAQSDSFGIDPRRVAAYGVSAGAHLAVMAAALDDSLSHAGAGPSPAPNALVLVSPALALESDTWVQRLLLGRATVQSISPSTNVRRGMPPTLILQGDVDTVTPLAGNKRFCERMRGAGNACELHVYEGFGHLFTPAGIPDGGWPQPDSATSADAGVRAERFLASLKFIDEVRE